MKATKLVSCCVCGVVFQRDVKRFSDPICSADCLKALCADERHTDSTNERLALRMSWENEKVEPGSVKLFVHSVASYRSEPERKLANLFSRMKLKYAYEPLVFYLKIKNKLEGYVPDFRTPGTFIEVKGRWTLEGRKKYEQFKKTFPWISIILLDTATISEFRGATDARLRRNRR